MKRVALSVVVLMFGVATVVFAQQERQVFLSLTKYEQSFQKLPTNVTVIDQKQIADSHSQSVGDLLENELSIVVKKNGSAGQTASIFMRGSSSRETLVLIDGRRINEMAGGGVDFASIPVDIIEKIEIIRGSGAAIYGTSAFGGVINIITKKAKASSPLLDLGFSYGKYNTYNPSLSLAYYETKFAVLISGSYLESYGLQIPDDNTRFENNNIFISAQYFINEKSVFSLTGNNYESRLGVPGTLTDTSDFRTQYNYQKDHNQYIKFDYSLDFENESSLKLNTYRVNNVRNFFDATYNPYATYDSFFKPSFDRSRFQYTSDTSGAGFDFNFKQIILVGAQWVDENYKKQELESHIQSKKYNDNYALYIQANLDLWKFRFIPSIRGDRNLIFGNVLTPAISIVFNANEEIKLSANAGKIWTAPSFDDLYWDDTYMYGNPKLKPEQGMSYDAGAEFIYKNIKLAGTLFYIDTDKLIAWTPVDPSDSWSASTPENIDKTIQKGFEFEAGYIFNSWLSNKANYTFTNATNESDDIYKGKYLPYIPKNIFSYTLTIKPVKDLSISGIISYRDKVFISKSNDDKKLNRSQVEDNLPELVTLNATINYNLNKNVSLWLRGINLTDERYEMQAGYLMPRRSVYAGVSVKFWR
jgi:outer membrane cobalamin receptor